MHAASQQAHTRAQGADLEDSSPEAGHQLGSDHSTLAAVGIEVGLACSNQQDQQGPRASQSVCLAQQKPANVSSSSTRAAQCTLAAHGSNDPAPSTVS